MKSREFYACGASALVLFLAASPSVAAAQTETEPTAADQTTNVGDVVVTASRLRANGFTAPTPTTVVGTEVLNALATTNVADVLNQLPAFRADYSTAAAGNRSFSVGSSYANLRSLGSTRTLTLIGGQRVVPSAVTGQADLNLVPSLLIERIDVVTGGASAAWGSDAVAGVVNVILDTDFEGVKLETSYGISRYGDNEEAAFAIAAGRSFLEGRFHVFGGGEYSNNGGGDSMYSRDWGAEEWAIINNPTPADGRGSLLLSPNVHFSNMSPGGMINAGPLRGTQFLAGGQTSAFQYGSDVSPSYMVGGQGYGETTYTALVSTPLERGNFMARATFDLTDSVSVFLEGAYAWANASNRGAQPRDTALNIRADNAYLPSSVRNAMTANNLSTITVGRQSYDVGFSTNTDEREIQRFVLGLQGDFGGWGWEAYHQYGRTDYTGQLLNGRVNSRWTQSIDAVRNGAGDIVCRSTLTNPGNGCVPANIFGDGSISQAAMDYFMADQLYELRYEQKVTALNVSGTPFNNWAGPVSVAVGAEYREEEAVGVSDPLSQAGAFNIGNQKAIKGAFDVREAYAEVGVPIFRDSPLGQSLDLNAAVRITDYSTSGNVTTWKVGGVWDVDPAWRVRVTRSRDIRAPNISELFTQSSQSNQTIRNPVTLVSGIIPNITVGNPNLRPETADTLTAGVVYRPEFLPGFSASVDVYDIALDDAISQVAAQLAVDRCFQGTAAFCNFVTTNGSGVITQVTLPIINLASVKTRGVDLEVGYRRPLDVFGLQGTAGARVFVNYVDRLIVDDSTAVVDRAGEVGNGRLNSFNIPHWRWNAMLNYTAGPYSMNLIGRYVGGGKIDNTYTDAVLADNDVDGRFYVDLSGSIDLATGPSGEPIQLFGLVRNLFDRDPPIAPQVSAIPTNATLYDTIGQTFRVGLRMSF